MKQRLYAAYGSNLNLRQMKYRCPGAQLIGTGEIENYELQFKGRPSNAFATIAPKEGSRVPVALWKIGPKEEHALDRYEGFPSHYFKRNLPVQAAGKEVTAMAYIMDLKMDFGLPSQGYYQTVLEGYLDCGLDEKHLNEALLDSVRQYFDMEPSGPEEEYDWDLFDLGEQIHL